MDLNIHDFYCLGALLLSMWNDHSHRKVNFKSAFCSHACLLISATGKCLKMIVQSQISRHTLKILFTKYLYKCN